MDRSEKWVIYERWTNNFDLKKVVEFFLKLLNLLPQALSTESGADAEVTKSSIADLLQALILEEFEQLQVG